MKPLFMLSVGSLLIHSAVASEIKQFDAFGLKKLNVHHTSGKVTIFPIENTNGKDAKASITLNKNRFSDSCEMIIEKIDDTLRINVKDHSSSFSNRFSFPKDGCDIDFQIKVPKTMDLDLSMGAGTFTINDIQGKLTYQLGSGNLLADGLFKQIDGKSGSGNTTIKGLTTGGNLKTGSGRIDLTFTSVPKEGELDIKTGSGNVKLMLPRGSKIKTNVMTGSGQYTNEIGDSPDSQFLVSMKAGSGNLRIKPY